MPDSGAAFTDIFFPVLFEIGFQFFFPEGKAGREGGDIGNCQQVDLIPPYLGGNFGVKMESLRTAPLEKRRAMDTLLRKRPAPLSSIL